ncbi:MAG: hypothetical protein ACFFCS_22005 [Candidatus Hodarchaeota archaeon]
MGFVSTIVYMFIAGIVLQLWYRKSLRKKNKDLKFILAVALLLVTWIVQLLMYFNFLPNPSLFLPWVQAQDGRTWMWNSWQFWRFTGASPKMIMPQGMADYAIILSLSYTLWLYAGIKAGKILFGNKTFERGVLWLFTLEKTPPVPKIVEKKEKEKLEKEQLDRK